MLLNNFIPNIPVFSGIKENDSLQTQQQFLSLKKKYRMVLRNRIGMFTEHIQNYQSKQPFSKDPQEKIFQKVFKDANFIVANPIRFQIGGMDLPNVDQFVCHRPGDDAPSCLLDNVISEFTNDSRKASTHFLTGQDGTIVQMVDLKDTAWHTGVGHNAWSVGVEMEGAVGSPISEQNYRAVASIIARISLLSAKFVIDDNHIVEHRKLLPQMKRDVGAPFQKQKLIDLALQLVGTYNKDDLFVQLSAGDAVKAAMASVVALSTWGGLSTADLATMQSMANKTATISRSINFATFSRTDITNTASQQAVSLAESDARLLAFHLAISGIVSVAKPQNNVVGVLFDRNTGLYNDGRTQ